MSRKHGSRSTFPSTPRIINGRPWTPPWEAADEVRKKAQAGHLARAKYGQRLVIEYMEPATWRAQATDRALWHVGLMLWGNCDRLSRVEMAVMGNLLHRQRGDSHYPLPMIAGWVHDAKSNVTRALSTLATRHMIVNLSTGKKRVLAVMPSPELWRLGPVLSP
jgi:hypothetical protein